MVIFIGYEVNKDYIAKELCENKDKPKSCCEGSCFLKKELEQENKQDVPPLKEKQESVQFFERTKIVQFAGSNEVNKIIDFYSLTIQPGYLSDIFHPPSC